MRTLACALAAALTACGASQPSGPRADATPEAAADDAAPDGAAPDGAAPDVAAPDGAAPDVAVPDGAAPDVAAPDVAADVADDRYVPPLPLCSRPLIPVSGARVSSQRPTLQFARAPGLTRTRVELCRDRACSVVVAALESTADYVVPEAPLAPGTYFWRLVPRNADGQSCTSPTWQFTVPTRNLVSSRTWGTTLDLNGDGHGDLAVVSSGATASVRVYHGSTAGLGAEPAVTLTGLPGALGATPLPPVAVSAGDVNGDGFVDLAVGLPAASNGAGEVRIFTGSPTGISTTPRTTILAPDGPHGRFGVALAGVGDLEGDGFCDLVVGAPRAMAATPGDPPTVPGRVYSFHGNERGIREAPTGTLTGPGAGGGLFGAAVAEAGDVNGDRFPDVVVGAPGEGVAYVFRSTIVGLDRRFLAALRDPEARGFGARVGGAGDTDGDNRSDVFVTGDATATRVVLRPAGTDGAFTPAPRVLTVPGEDFGRDVAAGDFDADGFADLAVGAPGASGGGAVHVFRGGATGLAATSLALRHAGASGLGRVVASAGDSDRDGSSDLVAAGAAGPLVVFAGAAMARARAVPHADPIASLSGATNGL